MAVWDLTKNDIQRRIEAKVRSLRRGKMEVTAEDRFCIFESINEAIIDLSLEPGIDAPMPTVTHTTVTTTADTNYIDLDASYITVIDGTLRIVEQDQILTRFSGALRDFYLFDPGEDISSSFPTYYAIDSNGSGAIRLRLRSTPNAVYTINLDVEAMPDEDSISTYPVWYLPCLRSKATSVALENLGLDWVSDERRYKNRLNHIKNKARGYSGPIHLNFKHKEVRPVPPELRATI